MSAVYAVGIDIGGTHLRIGLVSTQAEAVCCESVPQRDVLAKDPIGNLAKFVRDYLQRHGQQASALGVGLPATLNKERSTVLSAPNIEGFNGVNVRKELEERLFLPVFPEKDVNALLLYDLHRFELPGDEIVIACYAGTGLGNAISLNGNILTGHNGSCGELGHIPVRGAGGLCGCGNIGCAETVAGGAYLARLRGELFPATPIGELFERHKDHESLQTYVQDLAMAIATEINILDPKYVILGGGVICMAGFPRGALEAHIRKHARKPLPEANLHFIYSENGGSNGVIGAGLRAWKELE